MATYFLFAFTACLRPNDCSLRPGSMEMGFRCSPSLVSPPFTLRHLTYATSCRTNGSQTSARAHASREWTFFCWLRAALCTVCGPREVHRARQFLEMTRPRATNFSQKRCSVDSGLLKAWELCRPSVGPRQWWQEGTPRGRPPSRFVPSGAHAIVEWDRDENEVGGRTPRCVDSNSGGACS
jgi:hypothetical protein